jgi:dihydroxy-acid dehydratase
MHLIAMAHSVDIEITLKDFQDISDKTHYLLI